MIYGASSDAIEDADVFWHQLYWLLYFNIFYLFSFILSNENKCCKLTVALIELLFKSYQMNA